jgi:hypothetical protein
MIWELGVSCGLVFVGHARTLYRVWRVNTAADVYEERMARYDGPLVDRTDPEDITAWHKAAKKDYAKEIEAAYATPNVYQRMIVLPDVGMATFHDTEMARVEAIRDNPQAMYLDAMAAMLTSHTCRACGRTSYNENDVKYKYCGYCHHFCRDAGEIFT